MKRNSHRISRRQADLILRFAIEGLEQRILFCGTTPEALMAAGVPEYMIMADGDIMYSDFLKLSPAVQSKVDAHSVQSQLSEHAIDWDKELGLPMFPGGPETEPHTRDVQTITDSYPDFFPSIYTQQGSAIGIDQTAQPGRTLLRFGTQVNNQGDGPCSLISGRPGVDTIPTGAPITSWVNADGSQNVLQAVYAFNTATNRFALSYYRAAGRFTYHPGHGHFHFDGYATYRLRTSVGGQPGPYVTRTDGSEVVGAKVGFCLLDYVTGTWLTESGASNTSLANYNKAGQPTTGCGLIQGVTVGHADGYASYLDGQWIDVTDVPNGKYFLEISLDGNNAVMETNEDNNTKTFAYNLNVTTTSQGGVPEDVFDATGAGNDTFATATNMHALGVFTQPSLTNDWGEDLDYFKFTATSSGVGTITASVADNHNDNIDLYLYNAQHTQIAASTADLPESGQQVYPTEVVTYNFVKGQTYYVRTNGFNSTPIGNYQIAWNLKPTLSYPTGNRLASPIGPVSGTFLVSRNGPISLPITLDLTIGGTGVRDVDYVLTASGGNLVGNQLTIGDLATGCTLIVTPTAGALPQANSSKTVTLTIAASSTYASPGTASTVTIDNSGRLNIRPGGGSTPGAIPGIVPGSDDDLIDALSGGGSLPLLTM